MDFTVTIPFEDEYGSIVSLSWVLPEDTNDPKYYKKDPNTGEFFDFEFDTTSGQGYKYDEATNILTVYVKDDGQYDSDPTPGVVNDPGIIVETGIIVDKKK